MPSRPLFLVGAVRAVFLLTKRRLQLALVLLAHLLFAPELFCAFHFVLVRLNLPLITAS